MGYPRIPNSGSGRTMGLRGVMGYEKYRLIGVLLSSDLRVLARMPMRLPIMLFRARSRASGKCIACAFHNSP